MKALPFFIASAVAIGVSIGFTASHQRHVTSLTKEIISLDNDGADTTTQQETLTSYVRAHMGTTTQFMLEGSYSRAAAAAQSAAQPGGGDGQVYAQAQAACNQGHADSISQARCVQAYVASHATPAANPQPAGQPNPSDYSRSVNSRGWTPDNAGLAVLLGLIAFVSGIYVMLLNWWKNIGR